MTMILGRLSLTLLFVQFLNCLDLLLEFHPPILEPDFDLSLGQTKSVGHLDPTPPGQVMVRVKLLLEFQGLVPRVRLTASPSESLCPGQSCFRRFRKRFD